MNRSNHHKVLIIEDDDKLAELLLGQLERFGFQTVRASNFAQLDTEVDKEAPSLILLDVNLPYYDGFYWCRRIRMQSKVPILFISARSGEMDQVLALENGGDDYVTKPFHPEVLIAKIRALLRRVYGEYAEDTISELQEYGGLQLDIDRNCVMYENKKASLSMTERQLLSQLILAKGKIVERDTLLTALWDDTEFVDDNTLTVNVARVRKKLMEIGLVDVIQTVRGQGYRLVLSEEGDIR